MNSPATRPLAKLLKAYLYLSCTCLTRKRYIIPYTLYDLIQAEVIENIYVSYKTIERNTYNHALVQLVFFCGHGRCHDNGRAHNL